MNTFGGLVDSGANWVLGAVVLATSFASAAVFVELLPPLVFMMSKMRDVGCEFGLRR